MKLLQGVKVLEFTPMNSTFFSAMHLGFDPIKVQGVSDHIENPAPQVAQHTDEIFSTLVGYSSEQITELKKSGVIF